MVDTCSRIRDEYGLHVFHLPTKNANRSRPTRKIMVLGGARIVIGQVYRVRLPLRAIAALAMREEMAMKRLWPTAILKKSVSTDYDTSDRLYFEPVTLEDVLEIVAKETRGA